MITHLYFDWSGTLARSGSKAILISVCPREEKLATLFPDTVGVLEMLVRTGYKIGIISNSKISTIAMWRVLHELGIAHLFGAAVIFTDGSEVCKKPGAGVFSLALDIDSIQPDQAVMIGNDYEKDVLGARAAGLHAIFLQHDGTSTDPRRIRTLTELVDALASYA
jgi:putative hydrolase of the HAD superfamily